MSIYTPENLAAMTAGELADHLFEQVDAEPHGESESIRLLEAEVARRGLSPSDLSAAWNALAAKQQREE